MKKLDGFLWYPALLLAGVCIGYFFWYDGYANNKKAGEYIKKERAYIDTLSSDVDRYLSTCVDTTVYIKFGDTINTSVTFADSTKKRWYSIRYVGIK